MMRARTQRDYENSNRLQRLWILTEILAILAKVSENEVVIRSAPVWSATRWQSRLGTCASVPTVRQIESSDPITRAFRVDGRQPLPWDYFRVARHSTATWEYGVLH